MKFYRSAALVFGLCTRLLSSAQAAEAAPQLGLPDDVMASMQTIDPHRIAEHVRFLANDADKQSCTRRITTTSASILH